MVFKHVCKIVLYTSIAIVLIATLPGLLEINPKSVFIKPCPQFEGSLKVNNKLDNIEKLLHHEIEGPESITSYKGDLYTGLADGRIVRINKNNQIQTIAQLKKCAGIWEEHICGRPLGLRFDDKGYLHVANAYVGILKINIQNGHVETIYSSQTEVNGKKSMVVNDLDISKNGDIYFSDSGKWPLMKLLYEYLEGIPNGRVLHWSAKSNKTQVLIEGVAFANGIQLSPEEDYLLVSESFYHRILKYYLKGSKKGQLEVFIDNIPGVGDNIRINPRGNYWVGQCSTRLPGHKSPMEIIGNQVLLRKVVARLVHIFQSAVLFVKTHLISNVILDQLWYRTAHFYPYARIGAPQYGLILEVDPKGQIIQSLHAPNGSIYFISEVYELDNNLYLGSPWHDYIGKIKV